MRRPAVRARYRVRRSSLIGARGVCSAAMRRMIGTLAVLAALVVAGSASSSGRNPVLGTWTATTTCAAQYKALMAYPGLRKYAVENGFIPGVRSPGQVKHPTNPCKGAVARKHSHFFTKQGVFGSLDWTGEQVDDGTYTLAGTNRLTIAKEFPSVTFTYTVKGNRIRFTPQIPKACSSFRCAWSLSMAIAGTTWRAARRGPSPSSPPWEDRRPNRRQVTNGRTAASQSGG